MSDKINGQNKNTIDNNEITNVKYNDIYNFIENASRDFINELEFKKQDNIAMFSPRIKVSDDEPKRSEKNGNGEYINRFILFIVLLVVFICFSSLIYKHIVFLGSIVLIFIQGAFETYFGLNIENFLKILNPLLVIFKVAFDVNNIKRNVKESLFKYLKTNYKQLTVLNLLKKLTVSYLIIVCIGVSVYYAVPKLNAMAQEKADLICEVVYSKNLGIDPINTDEQTVITDNDYDENTDYTKYTFIICNKVYSIDDTMYDDIYIVDNQNELIPYLESIQFSKQSNFSGEFFSPPIQKKEDNFMYPKEEAKEYAERYGKNKIWYSNLPKEDALLDAIKAENTFSEQYKNYYIYWRLSNNVQMLGLEYINQNADKNTAKYYYMCAIKYDLLCVQYSNDWDEYYDAVDRLYNRYQDILSECNTKDKKEKNLLESYVDELAYYLGKK